MVQIPSIYQVRTGVRQLVSSAVSILPSDTGVAIERRFRGYEEYKKLQRADGVIVSFGKSGRTWLRVLISRYFSKKYGLPEGRIMGFDEFHRDNKAIPVLFFTHDNYIKDYLGHDNKFEIYGKSRVVLMVRDPRDTAVSQYFQWKHRMKGRKKVINDYPENDEGVNAFISGQEAGIPKIIEFMNAWGKDIERFPDLLVVKYEDLRAATATQLRRILKFFGEDATDAQLEDCVSYASIENMRKMEQENAGRLLANSRLRPGDANDPSSFKVRRAKVGGWRDYMSEEEVGAIDTMVRTRLSPVFGYT